MCTHVNKVKCFPSHRDQKLIGELFEQWLSAKEDWMQSSIVANSTKTMSQKKKGKYCMLEVRTLRSRFGAGIAKQLREEKKALEEGKSPDDPTIYWMQHPDIKSEAR